MFYNPNYLTSTKKVCKAYVISAHFKDGTLGLLNVSIASNQVDDKDLCIGFFTKQRVNKLHDELEGDRTVFLIISL